MEDDRKDIFILSILLAITIVRIVVLKREGPKIITMSFFRKVIPVKL